MRSLTHGWRESLWKVIKAFDTERTRIGDSFTAEFVYRLVSNPFLLKVYMSGESFSINVQSIHLQVVQLVYKKPLGLQQCVAN